MHIERLHVRSVRILEEIQIDAGEGINLIYGKNASGKTSLLEAIYILSRGRSFRTPRIQEVISNKTDRLQISIEGRCETLGRITARIEKTHNKTNIKFNGFPVPKISEQASQIPIILITPESRTLVIGDPRHRRHWLDWAMFHVEPSYLDHWRTFHRALRQRNHLLQKGKPHKEQLAIWEGAMAKESGTITTLKKSFIADLQQHFDPLAQETGLPQVMIELQRGWPDEATLGEALEGARTSDLKLGYTRYGIHRAEVLFKQAGHNIARIFSRGEIKRFIPALLMAQARLFQEQRGCSPMILLDDLAAELDLESREKVWRLLGESKSQVFATTTEELSRAWGQNSDFVFHVEHGKIRKMIN